MTAFLYCNLRKTPYLTGVQGYQCRELASSFAVTNKCSRAFLTVSRNQAFVQREGLSSNHPDGKHLHSASQRVLLSLVKWGLKKF